MLERAYLLLTNSLNVSHELGNLIVESLLSFLLELGKFLLVIGIFGSDNSSGN